MAVQDRVAVITGATGGLGRVAAVQFARQGARLALISTNLSKLEQLSGELNLPPEQVLLHPADLRDPDASRQAAQAVLNTFGHIDILLHLVGGWTGGQSLVDSNPQDLEAMLQKHVWTTYSLFRPFVPHLLANSWGRVLLVSSPSASRPPARGGLYAAAKAAQEALLLTLAQELKDSGVTANILLVRTIDTLHERERDRQPANAFWTTPEEITAAILYLCSDQAGMVNGARLPIFGSSI